MMNELQVVDNFTYLSRAVQIDDEIAGRTAKASLILVDFVQMSGVKWNQTLHSPKSHLLRLYSPVCVGPSRKPRRPVFSQRGSNKSWGLLL